jgi:hypothetical protein
MTGKTIRIGGASGSWGDSPMAIPQLLRADVQYLMMDYLAEVTMSLLARAKMKDAEAGFPADFVAYLKPALAELANRKVRVISNGGGVNPQAAKRALEKACAEAGVDLKIAVVEGDDLLPLADEIRKRDVREATSGEPLPARLLTANAYLGALPIAAALSKGADIVITGRCADSALALGILMHEFGWVETNYDLLAAGSLVGHILECGPQSTGGTFTDWEQVPDWHNIGYPIAECSADGSFILTKPADTGGLVVPGAVAEQILYEIGDPTAYMLPDVIADFSCVTVAQVGPHRVKVEGARGRAPTRQYKVSATYQDGYRAVASISIVGMDAARKAERTGEALLQRARMLFAEKSKADFTATHIEALGAEASYGDGSRSRKTREVLLRLVVEHTDRDALEIFARELGSVGLSFAPGTTGIYSGRPKPTPVVRLFTFFIEKTVLPPPRVTVGSSATFDVAIPPGFQIIQAPSQDTPTATPSTEPQVEIELLRLAWARSGDKGNSSNIAIIARQPEYLDCIRAALTPERMAQHFAGTVYGKVERYDAPGLHALNFLLSDALGGGGMASRRIDPQGKAYGQRALEMKIPVPIKVARLLDR